MDSYFVDPNNHQLKPVNSRYIVKMYCKSCSKIWDKRQCFKYTKIGDVTTVKQRGKVIKQIQT